VDGLKDIQLLTDLKTLLISAPEDVEQEGLLNIALSLPAACEFIVNHKEYEYLQ
jgi:hypothetical protein